MLPHCMICLSTLRRRHTTLLRYISAGLEFYGDFGCYDVELTFASNYVIGATGFLQNREEVLPKDLKPTGYKIRLTDENLRPEGVKRRGPAQAKKKIRGFRPPFPSKSGGNPESKPKRTKCASKLWSAGFFQ